MASVPGYFGDASEPIFGWFHYPEGRVCRGGVVLCSSLAVEEMPAHPAYRYLALALERNGFAVVRFDYPGTGDSGGELDDPRILHRWHRSTAAAIAVLRDAGVTSIGVLGMRFGALL